MELRAKTIKYSKEKRSKLRNEEKALQEELQELDGKICNNDAFDQETLEKYEAAKDKLKRIHDTRVKEAIFRSKTKWFEQGEKPTKYFFNLEKALQEELQELDGKICNNDAFDQETLEKYEAAKDKLKRIHDTRVKEAIFRSKTKWFEQGEKPTKYFFNLEKNNYEKKLIREVKSENDR